MKRHHLATCNWFLTGKTHKAKIKLGFVHISHYCFFASSSTAWKPIVLKQFPWSSLSWGSKSNSFSSHSYGYIFQLKENEIRSGKKINFFSFLPFIPFLKCLYVYLFWSTLSSQIPFHNHKMVLTVHKFLFDFIFFILLSEPRMQVMRNNLYIVIDRKTGFSIPHKDILFNSTPLLIRHFNEQCTVSSN